MADIATLGLKIDSSQASAASKELDKLTASGAKAERQAQMLGASFKTSGVAAKDLLDNTNLSTAARARLTAQLEKQGVSTTAVTKASATLVKGQTEATKGALSLAAASGALGDEHDKAEKKTSNFANTITRRFILGYAVSQVRTLITAVAGLNSELARAGDIGKLTGLGSGGTQGLISAGGAKGITSDAMAAAMIAFNQQIPLAKAGVGSLGELLRANRIAVTGTADAFFKVADLVKNAKDDTARLSMLQQAGLPATMEMARFMGQGSEAIRQQVTDTAKLTDSQIEAAQKIRDEWNRNWQEFRDGGTVAVAGVITKIGELARWANGIGQSLHPNMLGLRLNNAFDDVGGTSNSSLKSGLEKRAAALRSGGSADGTPSRDYATEKAIAQDRISKAQTYLGLLGATTTALESRRAVELQIQAAGLNGVSIDKARAETLKRLAEEQNLGITAMKQSADAQRVEAETIGMSVGQATAYAAAQNAINDAKRNSKALTEGNVEAIRREADALGAAAQNADNMRFTYESLVRGPMQTFRSEIAQGATAMEALKAAGLSALNAISSKLMDMAAQQLWASAFGGGKGGGGLLSLLGFGGGGGASPVAIDPMGFARGGIPPGSGISAFSNQIITKPTLFAFAKGAGLMGEAGDEAVMPLIRTPSGDLGVRAQGGGAGVNVTIHQENHFVNADPGSEARMRQWAKQTKDAAVDEAVQRVAKVAGNKPSYMPGSR